MRWEAKSCLSLTTTLDARTLSFKADNIGFFLQPTCFKFSKRSIFLRLFFCLFVNLQQSKFQICKAVTSTSLLLFVLQTFCLFVRQQNKFQSFKVSKLQSSKASKFQSSQHLFFKLLTCRFCLSGQFSTTYKVPNFKSSRHFFCVCAFLLKVSFVTSTWHKQRKNPLSHQFGTNKETNHR